MARHESRSPLPSDTDGREDIMPGQDSGAASPDTETSPLPPDPSGREDIISEEPPDRDGSAPAR
jgi:hypothetical protein